MRDAGWPGQFIAGNCALGGTGFALTGPWLREQAQGQRRMERDADFLALAEAGQFLPGSV